MRGSTFVYVGNARSNDVHVLRLDPDLGGLEPVQVAPLPAVDATGASTPMAISHDRRFLFVAVRAEPYPVASFAVAQEDGTLDRLATGRLAGSMAFIALDRSGRFLLSASYDGHRIAVNPVGGDGVVHPPQQVTATEPNAHAILADPANRFVLATSLGGDVVVSFPFDAASGRLASGGRVMRARSGSGPRHLAFHPSGSVVYLLNERAASIDVLAYDGETGELEPVQTASVLHARFEGRPWAADVHVTPDGRFLYASERTSSTLAVFAVDPSDGALTPVAHAATETQPRSFAIDPSGRFVVVAGETSNALGVHRIEPSTGALTKVGSTFVGESPNWVEVVELTRPEPAAIG